LFQSFFLCEIEPPMNSIDLNPENILPHRNRMLLVDSIIEVDDNGAVTRSVVTKKWPFFDGQNVRSIVLIELVAQTAGIHNGWIREKKYGPTADKKGWIVGIRQASLAVDAIPLNTGLIARTENRMVFDGFRDIYGSVEWESNIIAEIMLQLLRSDSPTDASV
jgi:predicted hotdog family 3-hydroxylacyl-ACP dehydratase